jgi:hypothetical protein
MTDDAQSPTMVAYKLYNRRVKFPGCVAFPSALDDAYRMSQRIGPLYDEYQEYSYPHRLRIYISCDCFPLVVILVPHWILNPKSIPS